MIVIFILNETIMRQLQDSLQVAATAAYFQNEIIVDAI